MPISDRASKDRGGCLDDDFFFSRSYASKDSEQARKGLLCRGHADAERGTFTETRHAIPLTFCWHASRAAKTSNQDIQVVGAKRPGVWRRRALTWYRDIHALVRAWCISQIVSHCPIQRRVVGMQPGLAAHYFECCGSGQFSPIGSDFDARRQSRTADGVNAGDTYACWLSAIRERCTLGRTLNRVFKAHWDRPSHQAICLAAAGTVLAK